MNVAVSAAKKGGYVRLNFSFSELTNLSEYLATAATLLNLAEISEMRQMVEMRGLSYYYYWSLMQSVVTSCGKEIHEDVHMQINKSPEDSRY
jgi:hypothetical protein